MRRRRGAIHRMMEPYQDRVSSVTPSPGVTPFISPFTQLHPSVIIPPPAVIPSSKKIHRVPPSGIEVMASQASLLPVDAVHTSLKPSIIARQRNACIENQIRRLREKLENLNGPQSDLRPTCVYDIFLRWINGARSHTGAGDLAESRRCQTDNLKKRIRQLEGQLGSGWALGLSDDTPTNIV